MLTAVHRDHVAFVAEQLHEHVHLPVGLQQEAAQGAVQEEHVRKRAALVLLLEQRQSQAKDDDVAAMMRAISLVQQQHAAQRAVNAIAVHGHELVRQDHVLQRLDADVRLRVDDLPTQLEQLGETDLVQQLTASYVGVHSRRAGHVAAAISAAERHSPEHKGIAQRIPEIEHERQNRAQD